MNFSEWLKARGLELDKLDAETKPVLEKIHQMEQAEVKRAVEAAVAEAKAACEAEKKSALEGIEKRMSALELKLKAPPAGTEEPAKVEDEKASEKTPEQARAELKDMVRRALTNR